MTLTDPNADLIGFRFVDDRGRELEVAETWDVNGNYVLCVDHEAPPNEDWSVRVASQVRAAKLIGETR